MLESKERPHTKQNNDALSFFPAFVSFGDEQVYSCSVTSLYSVVKASDSFKFFDLMHFVSFFFSVSKRERETSFPFYCFSFNFLLLYFLGAFFVASFHCIISYIYTAFSVPSIFKGSNFLYLFNERTEKKGSRNQRKRDKKQYGIKGM